MKDKNKKKLENDNDEREELNFSISDETNTELESTISDSVFMSEFGGFLPEQNFFIPQLG